MTELFISNIKIDIIKKDIKNIHLAVYPPKGRVRIAVPLSINDDAIRLFAISKLAWIKRNQKKYIEQDRQTPRQYKYRENHYYQGIRYMLRINESEDSQRVELKNKTYIDMYVKKGTNKEKRQSLLNEWYRTELKKQIPVLAKKWQKTMGISVDEFKIKLMKTKWGSCNIQANRIWINLELAKKPVRCLEYIIVHEMVHLLERRHNERFMSYMDKFLPQWRQYKQELNDFPVSHSSWGY